jgi:hypothetical protein
MSRLLCLSAALLATALLLPAAVIGPDAAGYTGRNNNDPGGLAFNWTDIRSTGTLIATNIDDNTYLTPLGAAFTFYGVNYSSARISSNGNIQFASSSPAFTDTPLTAAGFGPTIFAFWDDLQFSTSVDPAQGVHYQYFAAGVHPDLFGPTSVVQWTSNYYPTNGATIVRVQALLEHNTGRILLQYQNNAASRPNSNTVGIQDGNGVYLEWLSSTGGQPILGAPSTVLFTPAPEPGTYLLSGLGLLGLAWLRRR